MNPDPSPTVSNHDAKLDRYSRQILFDKIGEAGQRRLLDARVLLVGCGALGTVLANTLVRAGVGFLRIADRDFIELNNLQRQVLFDEADVRDHLPKAEAAARKLRAINSQVTIDPVIADVNHQNIERLAEGADLLLDGTDNFETRFLINDLAIKSKRPWIYGAAIGANGLVLPIIPGETPCLRCVFEEAPPPELNPTCDTAGVLATTVNLVASLQALEAMKILMGRANEVNRHLCHIDVWNGRYVNLNVQSSKDANDCICCKQRRFEFLDGGMGSAATALCGRDAVQVLRPGGGKVDFEGVAAKLRPIASGGLTYNRFLLKASVDGYELTLFADGRAIIKGTTNADQARAIYARYFGS